MSSRIGVFKYLLEAKGANSKVIPVFGDGELDTYWTRWWPECTGRVISFGLRKVLSGSNESESLPLPSLSHRLNLPLVVFCSRYFPAPNPDLSQTDIFKIVVGKPHEVKGKDVGRAHGEYCEELRELVRRRVGKRLEVV